MADKTAQGPRKKRRPRQYGRTDDHGRPPVPLFPDNIRRRLAGDSRYGFKSAVLDSFKEGETRPEDIVEEARVYFKSLWENDRKSGKDRHSHWLNSASSALTQLKATFRAQRLATYAFVRELALSKPELLKLDRLNHQRLEKRVNDQPEINLRKLLETLFELLRSHEPSEIALGIAGLTGRRQTEVTFSVIFDEPTAALAHRYPTFWSHVSGFSKKRKHDKYAVRARELPLLAPRAMIVEALRELRSLWPAKSHEEASKLYGHTLAAAHKKHLRKLGVRRMHDLRKTFAQLSFSYFNERDSVLPAFASMVLAHKRPLSKRIMTYLVIRTADQPTLQDLFRMCDCGLSVDTPEHHERLELSPAPPPQAPKDPGPRSGDVDLAISAFATLGASRPRGPQA